MAGDLFTGTLELLILRTLQGELIHGYAIARSIRDRTDGVLDVEQGALYPALHRLEKRGLLTSSWGTSRKNRKAKYYRLTGAGKKALGQAEDGRDRFVAAVQGVMGRL